MRTKASGPGHGRVERRRPNRFTVRDAGIAAALSLTWGAFVWFIIGGAIALFGNPWIA